MKRTCFRRGPYGLRINPDDIRMCFSFLRTAAAAVRKGRVDADHQPWVRWRMVGKPAWVFRRRP